MYLNKIKKEEVVYWRKANAIHAWFERNCGEGELENCEERYVSKDDLLKLKDDCQKVLKSSKLVYKEVPVKEYDSDKKEYVEVMRTRKVLDDTSLAEELLPTEAGFFFGSTLYDEDYVENLEYTVEQITEILKDPSIDGYSFSYHAWW
jgi:hypothetical protein